MCDDDDDGTGDDDNGAAADDDNGATASADNGADDDDDTLSAETDPGTDSLDDGADPNAAEQSGPVSREDVANARMAAEATGADTGGAEPGAPGAFPGAPGDPSAPDIGNYLRMVGASPDQLNLGQRDTQIASNMLQRFVAPGGGLQGVEQFLTTPRHIIRDENGNPVGTIDENGNVTPFGPNNPAPAGIGPAPAPTPSPSGSRFNPISSAAAGELTPASPPSAAPTGLGPTTAFDTARFPTAPGGGLSVDAQGNIVDANGNPIGGAFGNITNAAGGNLMGGAFNDPGMGPAPNAAIASDLAAARAPAGPSAPTPSVPSGAAATAQYGPGGIFAGGLANPNDLITAIQGGLTRGVAPPDASIQPTSPVFGAPVGTPPTMRGTPQQEVAQPSPPSTPDLPPTQQTPTSREIAQTPASLIPSGPYSSSLSDLASSLGERPGQSAVLPTLAQLLGLAR